SERADRADERRDVDERPRAVDRRDRVAERRERHGERSENVTPRLGPDEERNAAEPGEEAYEPWAADAVVPGEPQRQQSGEQRRRGLDHGCETGVDVRLGPRDRGDGDRRVDEADDDERAPRGARLAHDGPTAQADERNGEERDRSDPEPDADERRRLELADRDLDEHERGSPDRRERDQTA